MKLFAALIAQSRAIVALSVLVGLLSGICNSFLIALIASGLGESLSSDGRLIWTFVGICLVFPITRFFSEFLLIRLGQYTLLELRIQLGRRILSTPLRRLEEIGGPRLMASLTDDVMAISGALVVIPIFCINLAVVAGCLIYLGWLSTTVLLTVCAAIALGTSFYQLMVRLAMKWLGAMRQKQNELF